MLGTLEVELKAFAMCEIGADWALKVEPFDCVICHFVVQGSGFLEFDERRVRISEGMIVIVPPGTAKSICGPEPVSQQVTATESCESYRDGLLAFRARSAEPALVLGCATITATCGGNLGLFEALPEPMFAAIGGDRLFAAGFRALQRELTEPQIGAMIIAECLMKQTVVFLLREQLRGDAIVPLFDYLGDLRIVRTIAAMTGAPGDRHTIDSLAKIAGMSRSSFMAHFLRGYGISPGEFLKSARMRAAARMLLRSELPIKVLAAAVGYSSRSQFSRLFNECFGVRPSAYRTVNRSSNRTGGQGSLNRTVRQPMFSGEDSCSAMERDSNMARAAADAIEAVP